MLMVVCFNVLGEVGDRLFAAHHAERVLEPEVLDEEVVLLHVARGRVRALEVEREPLLDARAAGAACEVEEEREVEHDGRGEDRVAAEEVDLDLHLVAEPAEDVDVVPAFLRVAVRRVIVDADFVVEVAVEVGVGLGLEDRVEHAGLRDLLGAERVRVVEDLAVAVAEDVGREPAVDAEHAGFEAGGEDGLHHRLAGFEVLARDRHALCSASCSSAGKSAERFGAPFAYGTPSMMAA